MTQNEVPGYVVLPIDGPIKVVLVSDYASSYEAIKQNVGGYIDCVPLTSDCDMWVHDMGILLKLPLNPRASLLRMLTYGPQASPIAGDVVLTGGTDEEGNTLPLTVADIAQLKEMYS